MCMSGDRELSEHLWASGLTEVEVWVILCVRSSSCGCYRSGNQKRENQEVRPNLSNEKWRDIMKRTNSKSLLCPIITAIIATTVTGSMPSPSRVLENDLTSLSQKETLQRAGLHTEEPNGFPFEIRGSRFVRKRDGKPVFLNIIGYQPFEPGQGIGDDIREKRIRDDLRRWSAYQGGTELVVIRVYPQPSEEGNRLPKCFYDGVRDLGFWIIRDIYFDPNFCDPNATEKGEDAIDAVIAEVNDANALDRIFAWEIGNEFEPNEALCRGANEIEEFICDMCDHLDDQIRKFDTNSVSHLVTWQSWVRNDPLFTDGYPIEPNCLDYFSYNVYGYEPERLRDHQAGPVTGTPYQGYLAALKERHHDKPLVISETGLADSLLAEPDSNHRRLHPWYPTYRKGGLRSEQVAEGLADRYWDARLLRDQSDPNLVVAGAAMFEWNDEWNKLGDSNNQSSYPEEHFGFCEFKERAGGDGYQLRHKLQQETVRDLFALKFRNDPAASNAVEANTITLKVGEDTNINSVTAYGTEEVLRFRWDASRGYIVGDGSSAEFYAGDNALGPAKITSVSIDGNGYAIVSSSVINIEISEPNSIEILTLGTDKASGRVHNVNLEKYKLIVYIYVESWKLYAQPFDDQGSRTGKGMKSIWVDKNGYWWTPVHNQDSNPLYCWLVPKDFEPNDLEEFYWTPGRSIAFAKMVDINDADNDLLPNYWEQDYFGDIEDVNDRYDDPDKDGANNLEEFLTGASPNDPNDNDTDGDGLWDNWERRYFGRLTYGPNDDPDGDGLTNIEEHDPNIGTHPGRTSQDRDQDRLPDLWEIRWFNNLAQDANDNPDKDCLTNLDEYELGVNPVRHGGDLNCDWAVDPCDLDILASAWLSDPNDMRWNPACDIFKPNDNLINFLDFAFIAENWLLEL